MLSQPADKCKPIQKNNPSYIPLPPRTGPSQTQPHLLKNPQPAPHHPETSQAWRPFALPTTDLEVLLGHILNASAPLRSMGGVVAAVG